MDTKIAKGSIPVVLALLTASFVMIAAPFSVHADADQSTVTGTPSKSTSSLGATTSTSNTVSKLAAPTQSALITPAEGSKASSTETSKDVPPSVGNTKEAKTSVGNHGRLREELRDVARKFNPVSLVARRRYEKASATFPAFCHDWEQKLHERESNNLDHLEWKLRDGYETATYVGYGNIKSCDCKMSKEGLPIGKLTYHEMTYYLAGKTIDEAKHAKPKAVSDTPTLEIFSWEKSKWFY
jgi:hypothetical protein